MENQNINLIENENKSKKSKLLTWVATILLGAVVGLGAVFSSLSPKYLRSSAYSVDDTNYQITLTADELNNVQFVNFCSHLTSNISNLGSAVYDSINLNGSVSAAGPSYNCFFSSSSPDFSVGVAGFGNQSYYFSYTRNHAGSHYHEFTSDLVITFNSTYYESFSSALIEDINTYNYNNSTQHWFDELISLLTGGIVGLSGGIGSGVSILVSDIFISNNALSVFGGMIVVFAAISLAIGLCRFVMNFLTSLGAKK